MNFENAIVIHNAFGEGVVVSCDESRIKVSFNVGEKTLKYPWVFEHGYMKFQDENHQKEVDDKIRHQQAEAAQRLAEEEEKKKIDAEEQAKKKQAMKVIESDIPDTGTMKYTRQELILNILVGKTFTYHPFYGHRVCDPVTDNCFSNWYPCTFEVNGVTYHTTEQYMMAEKALLFKDHEIYNEIMNADNPKEYKKLGRMVRNYNDVIWNKHAYGIVLEGCKAKFSQNPEFAEVLLKTGDDIIIEASPRDQKWGIGYGKTNPLCMDPLKWRGSNLLGFVLMEVRDYLREKQ